MNGSTKDILTVDQMEVQSVVSRERDPYGQEGFASLAAKIRTSKEGEMKFLIAAKQQKAAIIVRCGRLEVKGKVFRCSGGDNGFEAVLALDDLHLMSQK